MTSFTSLIYIPTPRKTVFIATCLGKANSFGQKEDHISGYEWELYLEKEEGHTYLKCSKALILFGFCFILFYSFIFMIQEYTLRFPLI